MASEAEGSDAFVQRLRELTTSMNIKHDVRFTLEEAKNGRVLRQVSGDDSYVIILHCSPIEASYIFKNAKAMLGEGYALIGTEAIKTNDASILKDYPTGLLVVEHANRFELQDHLEDAFSVVSRAAQRIGMDESLKNNLSCWQPPDENHLNNARDLFT